MVSYADFLTLLLAFFVVMYAVSQRNEDKFRVLSRTLSEAFNMPERSINPIQVGEPVTAVNPGNVPDAIESPEQLPGSGRVDEDEPKATTSEPQLPEEFHRISQRVEEQFADLVARDLISVQGNEEWLEIELKSSLLFASGEATASAAARPIMQEMAAVVRDSELPIRVEGFTDDLPIATSIYPSNWELSSARAATIVKLLTEFGVGPTRLAAIGYGEFQPVAGNDSEEGRAANRRVVLMLSRSARLRPELTRTPLPAAAEPQAGTAPTQRHRPRRARRERPQPSRPKRRLRRTNRLRQSRRPRPRNRAWFASNWKVGVSCTPMIPREAAARVIQRAVRRARVPRPRPRHRSNRRSFSRRPAAIETAYEPRTADLRRAEGRARTVSGHVDAEIAGSDFGNTRSRRHMDMRGGGRARCGPGPRCAGSKP